MAYQYSFLGIQSVIFTEMPPYYFECQKHIGEEGSSLLTLEKQEKIEGSSNICTAFNQLVKL